MENPWIAALAAIALWWLSTGLLLMRVRAADNLGYAAHLRSCLYALPLFVAGFIGADATAGDASAMGAFLAFLCALAIWGWIELTFLSGLVTGPNASACPPGASGWDRFLRGFGTLAWHEMALLAALIALAGITEGAANAFALWTFAVLFFARISAKLNLFFGVPRIHTEFLPRTLSHLPSHFRKGPVTAFFPASVSLLTLAAFCWLERLLQAPTPGEVTGFSLLLALTLLALLEHWFMVLPLPDQKLWRWMLPAPKPAPAVPGSED